MGGVQIPVDVVWAMVQMGLLSEAPRTAGDVSWRGDLDKAWPIFLERLADCADDLIGRVSAEERLITDPDFCREIGFTSSAPGLRFDRVAAAADRAGYEVVFKKHVTLEWDRWADAHHGLTDPQPTASRHNAKHYTIKEADIQAVAPLANQGMTQREIAVEIDMGLTKVNRIHRAATAMGLIRVHRGRSLFRTG